MKFITLATALAAVIPATFGLTVSSPASVVSCEPTQLNWSGGSGPYYLSLVPAGQTAAAPIEQFPTQSGTSYTWNVDLAPGVSFTISLKDSSGTTAYSSIITVQAGTSLSCLTASASSGSSASAGATATHASGSASGSPATTGATGASSPSSGSPTNTASSSSATHSSAAGRVGASSAFGVAGIMGLVGAVLF